MATVEVSRTLVKSPPELWAELEGDCLSKAIGEVTVRPTEPERALAWEADGASGTAVLEPAGWCTTPHAGLRLPWRSISPLLLNGGVGRGLPPAQPGRTA